MAASLAWLPGAAVLGFLLLVVLAEAGPADVEMVFLKNAVAKGAGVCSFSAPCIAASVSVSALPSCPFLTLGSVVMQCAWMAAHRSTTSLPALVLAPITGWFTWRNADECAVRKGNFRGSSKFMRPLSFSGILGGSQKFNPDFYNWNRVKIRYCDGSSFTGDVEAVETAKNLYYRGFRVWRAIIDDLLTVRGMNKAQNVKCFSDAGFFLDGKDISGNNYARSIYKNVVNLHPMIHGRTDFLAALPKPSPSLGMFIDSCNAHCQSGAQDTWLADGSPLVNKTQIGKAVGDWYFEREVSRRIDCPYPCNPTCKNREDD
ncbi:hypothetical protein HU200_063355 [Digitaria exilis]|uniref:Pectin acetylesterase n=1 Tax=Digitaria exilis TaxID=1010633 RepID=A0A835DZ58_9POAL|nr:hypothetical protein HU200_063355 [Digitaria exilis]